MTETADEQAAEDALRNLYEDRRTEAYHRDLTPRPEPVFFKHLALVQRVLPPPARVLECGAGTGTFGRMLAETGYETTACDLYGADDLATLREANASISNLKFEHALQMSPRTTYDLVISVDVVEHLIRPDKILCDWIARVRPGGYLMLVCPNYSGALSPLLFASRIARGGKCWRYAGFHSALGHALENAWFGLRLALTGTPGFVRCLPHMENGAVVMHDSDMDAVHLPSSRGLRNFLVQEGLRIAHWRDTVPTGWLCFAQWLCPGHVPTVRLVAQKSAESETSS